MSESIRIPHRDLDAPLDYADACDLAREHLDPEDAAVARAALADPRISTYGDVLDVLEQAGPAGRREILGRARRAGGLPAVPKAQPPPPPLHVSSGPQRDGRGRIDALYAHGSCTNFLPGEGTQFAYLVLDQEERADGITALQALDLFEISVTPSPANADTRFQSVKGMGDEDLAETEAGTLLRLPRPLPAAAKNTLSPLARRSEIERLTSSMSSRISAQ